MPNIQRNQSSEYAETVAKLVATMPIEQAAQVYDFARFLLAQQERSASESEEDSTWLHDSEEQMQAEDAKWNLSAATGGTGLDALQAAALKEIESDETEPMFDDNGEFIVDELPHNS